MAFAVEDVRRALRDCYDPEIAVNIVELGIVESVAVERDDDAPGAGIAGVPARFRATVGIAPIPREGEATAALVERIKNRLAGVEAISEAIVVVLAEPVWTPQRISIEGYARLEELRAGKNQAAGSGKKALVQIEIP